MAAKTEARTTQYPTVRAGDKQQARSHFGYVSALNLIY